MEKKSKKAFEDLKEKIKKTSKEFKEEEVNEEKSEQKSEEKVLTREEELEKQVEEYKNDYLRCRADFDNFRRRNEQEKLELRDRVIVSFVEDLLPAIDNFEMSLKMTDNTEMFIKGVEMIHKNLVDTLAEHKIESFEPKVGEEFDPNLHEPIVIEQAEAEPGKILGVLKKGFMHKNIVVRPAKVQVKKEDIEE